MKIDYISDTHVDHWVKNTNQNKMKKFIEMLQFNADSEVLIIAGDISNYNSFSKEFLLMCKEHYKDVIFVRGNHDMYLIGKQQMKFALDWKLRMLEMKEFCHANQIQYLDGDIIEINGIKIGGVGMSWDKTYYEFLEERDVRDYEIQEFFKNTMNDARLIFEGSDNYMVNTAYGGKFLHSSFDQVAYFNSEKSKLESIRDYDDIDVMITHYVPTNPFIYGNDFHKNDSTSTFYMFNGEKDIERIQPKKWIFGHMHFNYNFMHKDVNFLCNPLGYPGENTYNEVKTFEI